MVFEAIPKEIFFYSKIINQGLDMSKNITLYELEVYATTRVLAERLIDSKNLTAET